MYTRFYFGCFSHVSVRLCFHTNDSVLHKIILMYFIYFINLFQPRPGDKWIAFFHSIFFYGFHISMHNVTYAYYLFNEFRFFRIIENHQGLNIINYNINSVSHYYLMALDRILICLYINVVNARTILTFFLQKNVVSLCFRTIWKKKILQKT